MCISLINFMNFQADFYFLIDIIVRATFHCLFRPHATFGPGSAYQESRARKLRVGSPPQLNNNLVTDFCWIIWVLFLLFNCYLIITHFYISTSFLSSITFFIIEFYGCKILFCTILLCWITSSVLSFLTVKYCFLLYLCTESHSSILSFLAVKFLFCTSNLFLL